MPPPNPRHLPGWAGLARKRVQQGRQRGEACCLCGKPIDWTKDGRSPYGPTAEHRHPLAYGGALLPDLDALGIAHRKCQSRQGALIANKRRGQKSAAAKQARTEATNADNNAGKANRKGKNNTPLFGGERNITPPSLYRMYPNSDGMSLDVVGRVDIASPYSESLRMPSDLDGLPRCFPAPHPDAVGSLGDDAARWIEGRMATDPRARGRSLRWWQWLVLQRVLEVKPSGEWCWPVSFVSVSRQQGKSLLLGELACWRAAHPDLFGGRQEVGHSASTVVLSRLLQGNWWSWAIESGFGIARQLGDSQVVWPDGSTWRTIAAENMFGRSLDLVLADEVWSWSAEDWWQATYPTLVERPLSQAVLFSAAHDEPRSLIPSLRGNPEVMVAEWGAEVSDPPEDPATWRKASAHWSEARGAAMALAVREASFASQWLNVFPESDGERMGWGQELAAMLPERSDRAWSGALVLAVESDLEGRSWGVAASDGRHVVAVSLPSKGAAWDWICARAPRADCILMHESVGANFPDPPLPITKVSITNARSATALFRDTVRAGQVSWDGDLADHLPWARVAGSGGHEYISGERSVGSVAVVKAAAWALWKAATAPEQEFFSA